MKTLVKVLGERNSGTNFLKEFLKLNFDCVLVDDGARPSRGDRDRIKSLKLPTDQKATMWEIARNLSHYENMSDNGGWKHGAPGAFFLERFAKPKNVFVIMIVRHPASWLTSMHKNPFHHQGAEIGNFSSFIRSPWVCQSRDEIPEMVLETPLHLLTRKYDQYLWLTHHHNKCAILRYEDLAIQPNAVRHRLGKLLPLSRADIAVPQSGARPFLGNQLPTASYVEKARSASFGLLDDQDKAYVNGHMLNTGLADIYPN